MARIDPGKEFILIVDDQDEIRRMIAKFLADRQYGVLTAESGEDAVKLVGKRGDIAVVLLDLVPERRVFTGTLTRLLTQTPRPAVIVLSVAGSKRAVDEAMRLGAFDYLIKPINTALLEVTVEAALADFEARDER